MGASLPSSLSSFTPHTIPPGLNLALLRQEFTPTPTHTQTTHTTPKHPGLNPYPTHHPKQGGTAARAAHTPTHPNPPPKKITGLNPNPLPLTPHHNPGLNLALLRQELLALPHVLDIHALHVWSPSNGPQVTRHYTTLC